MYISENFIGYDDYNDYISHHGILGQKWGIRRYQNKDGSLTDAGRKRYAGIAGKVRMVKDYSKYRKQKKTLAKARKARAQKKKEAAELEQKKKEWAKSPTLLRKNMDKYSDEELAKAIERLNTDKKLADLAQDKIDRGIKYVKMIGDIADTSTKVIKFAEEIEGLRSKKASTANVESQQRQTELKEQELRDKIEANKDQTKNANSSNEGNNKSSDGNNSSSNNKDTTNESGNSSSTESNKPSKIKEAVKKAGSQFKEELKTTKSVASAMTNTMKLDAKETAGKVGSKIKETASEIKTSATPKINSMKSDAKETMNKVSTISSVIGEGVKARAAEASATSSVIGAGLKMRVEDAKDSVSNTVQSVSHDIYKKYKGYNVDWLDADD